MWVNVVIAVVILAALALLFLTVNSFWTARPAVSQSAFGPTALPAAANPRGIPVEPRVGSMAPDFLLETPDGGTLRLSDLRGQVIILNFWASWCAPCRAEMADLQDAANRWAPQRVQVVGVNVQEDAGTINAFTERFRLSFPVAQDLSGRVTAEAYKVLGLPASFFIDRDGLIRDISPREMNAQTIEEKLQAVVRS